MALLNVKVFEIETFFDSAELICDDFLEADALIVEQSDQSLVIAPIAERVEAGATLLVNVQFLLHKFRGASTLYGEVECNVLVVEVTGYVDRGAA
jgi:hypothetical protein